VRNLYNIYIRIIAIIIIIKNASSHRYTYEYLRRIFDWKKTYLNAADTSSIAREINHRIQKKISSKCVDMRKCVAQNSEETASKRAIQIFLPSRLAMAAGGHRSLGRIRRAPPNVTERGRRRPSAAGGARARPKAPERDRRRPSAAEGARARPRARGATGRDEPR